MRLKLGTKAVTICRLFESHQRNESHQQKESHQLTKNRQKIVKPRAISRQGIL